MGRMRREFEGYRRLRTFSAAPKTALHRLFMGGDGGQRARHKIAVPTSRTACESRHHIARRKLNLGPAGGATAGSMQRGWGGRAPSWVHRGG